MYAQLGNTTRLQKGSTHGTGNSSLLLRVSGESNPLTLHIQRATSRTTNCTELQQRYTTAGRGAYYFGHSCGNATCYPQHGTKHAAPALKAGNYVLLNC